MKQTILSWSGGKDSSLALAALRANETTEVVGLLTSLTRGYDRISIHGVRRALLETQVQSIGLPLYEVTLEPASSNDAYESAFHAALAAVREAHPGLTSIAFGDLFLEDVRAYRERLLEGTGIEPLFPLWGEPTDRLARRFIDAGFGAILTCVDTTQMDARFAGRAYDHALLAELPATVDPAGERGEFHTFVHEGPIFSAPVPLIVGDVVIRDERFAYCDLKPSRVLAED
jgi:uncharacterized protein (TIGR00290 family)